MKISDFLLLGLMLFFFCSDTAKAELSIDCSGYPRPMCTLEYMPHCGVIEKTYSNKCDFCNAFVESGGQLQLEYKGECNQDKKATNSLSWLLPGLPIDCSGYPREACTKEYEPHCGFLRHTYSNKCDFCNAFAKSDGKLQLKFYGKCKEGLKE